MFLCYNLFARFITFQSYLEQKKFQSNFSCESIFETNPLSEPRVYIARTLFLESGSRGHQAQTCAYMPMQKNRDAEGGWVKAEKKKIEARAERAASANEIAPAIGGCLLAFDVRLVKCTGQDPPFEGSVAPPITGSRGSVPGSPGFFFFSSANNHASTISARPSNRHIASSFFCLRESLLRSPCPRPHTL